MLWPLMAISGRIMPSSENAEAVLRALGKSGAPVRELSLEDLQPDG